MLKLCGITIHCMLYEYNIILKILVFMLVVKLKNTFNNGPLGFS